DRVVATPVGGCPRGTKVSLVLRPERVSVGAGAEACANRFTARPLEVTFLGDQLRTRLAVLGGEDFIVKMQNAPGQGAPDIRAPVGIGWHPEDCRALAA